MPCPRAERAVSERAPLASGGAIPGMNRTASARLDYLQMRQQSRADTAIQEGRVMTRRKSHRADEAGICPGDRLANAGAAPGIRYLPAAPAGEGSRSEHTYGGPTGRRCCTFLLYSLFESFELCF